MLVDELGLTVPPQQDAETIEPTHNPLQFHAVHEEDRQRGAGVRRTLLRKASCRLCSSLSVRCQRAVAQGLKKLGRAGPIRELPLARSNRGSWPRPLDIEFPLAAWPPARANRRRSGCSSTRITGRTEAARACDEGFPRRLCLLHAEGALLERDAPRAFTTPSRLRRVTPRRMFDWMSRVRSTPVAGR